MQWKLNQRKSSRRGQIIPLTMLLLPVVLASCGFIFSISQGNYYQRILQNVADAGAIAAANEIQYGQTTDLQYVSGGDNHVFKKALAFTKAVAADNGIKINEDASNFVYPYVDPQNPQKTSHWDEVQVTAELLQPLGFLGFSHKVSAKAVAKGTLAFVPTKYSKNPCILQAIPRDASGRIDQSLAGITLWAPTNLQLPKCTVLSNGPIELNQVGANYENENNQPYLDHTLWNTNSSFWSAKDAKAIARNSGDKLAQASLSIGFPAPQYQPPGNKWTTYDFCAGGHGAFAGCQYPAQLATCNHPVDLIHNIAPQTTVNKAAPGPYVDRTTTYNYNSRPYTIPPGCYKSITITTDSENQGTRENRPSAEPFATFDDINPSSNSDSPGNPTPWEALFTNSTVVFPKGGVYVLGDIRIAATNITSEAGGTYIYAGGNVHIYSYTIDLHASGDTLLYGDSNCNYIDFYNLKDQILDGFINAGSARLKFDNSQFLPQTHWWSTDAITAMSVGSFIDQVVPNGKITIRDYNQDKALIDRIVGNTQASTQADQPPDKCVQTNNHDDSYQGACS